MSIGNIILVSLISMWLGYTIILPLIRLSAKYLYGRKLMKASAKMPIPGVRPDVQLSEPYVVTPTGQVLTLRDYMRTPEYTQFTSGSSAPSPRVTIEGFKTQNN